MNDQNESYLSVSEGAVCSSIINDTDIYKKLADASLDVLCAIDKTGAFILVNAAAKEQWGYSPYELTGKQFIDFVTDEDQALTGRALSMIKAGIILPYFTNRITCKNGSLKSFNWSGRWDKEDNLLYCVAKQIEPIGKESESLLCQKEREAFLKMSEQKYKLFFHQSPIPKWTFDVKTHRMMEVNEAALQLYGYTREEFLDLTIADLRLPDERPALYNSIEVYKDRTQAVYTATLRHMKKSGEVFFVHINAHIVELASSLLSLVIATDMTEKLQLQQKLIDEKVAAQKEVAKAIIHTQEKERSEIGKELHDNVNQILTTTKLYVENIRNYPDHSDAFIDKSVILVQKAINEIRSLSKQLVTPVIKDLGFKATIEELVAQYTALDIFRINYIFDIDEHQVDKHMQLTIYRIIQEQLNNVVKHAKATVVTIALFNDESGINVWVKDDGVGFKTSKAYSGLGLSNIKNRAEAYLGKVVLQSALGCGCSLSITFPVIQH